MLRLRGLRTVLPVAILALYVACDLGTDPDPDPTPEPGPDEQRPVVVSVAPDSVVLGAPGFYVTLEGRAEDDREVARVDYLMHLGKPPYTTTTGEAVVTRPAPAATFSASVLPPGEGVYQLYFTAHDAAGNQSDYHVDDVSAKLLVDWTPPAIGFALPHESVHEWADSTLDMTVVATDSTRVVDVVVSVNGGSPTPVIGRHALRVTPTFEVALRPGSNEVVVRAVDVAGRVAETTRTVVRVPPPDARFVSIEGTLRSRCGRTGDGTWLCWGDNRDGQLGNGTRSTSSVPFPLAAPSSFGSVDMVDGHGCGLDAAGAPYCWGADLFGLLGTDTLDMAPELPRPVVANLSLTVLRTGPYHNCGLAEDGDAWCWGNAQSGQLGQGDEQVGSCLPQLYPGHACTRTPVAVAVTEPLVDVAPGELFTCALTTAGGAWCWGNDSYGALGDGPSSSSGPHPVAVAGGLSFQGIAAGRSAACGTTADARVYCWGRNQGGLVGDGTGVDRDVPTAVDSPLRWRSVGFARHDLACGLAEDGTVHCWGAGRASPTPLAGGLVFTQVARSHACGVATDGGVYCWDGSLDPVRVGDAA